MFDLNFKDEYEVVHINNELGNCVVGGSGTYMNELYKHRNDKTGFVFVNSSYSDIKASDFMEQKDILIVNEDEAYKLARLKCKILVVQFYEFAKFLTPEIIGNKKVVYVIHSVPTPEPMPEENPFEGNEDVREKFEYLCEVADVLVCVSNAERTKLIKIFPQFEKKIRVIYNGITKENDHYINANYKNSRKIFGYIGRMDYRKGILECIKEVSDVDCELRLACPKNDFFYFEKILTYIEGAKIEDKIKFFGWCVGKRKRKFYESIDALIIPSLYEPFGYIALEAMQYGLPVISSSSGGLDEILENYKYKYHPYQTGALRKQMETFMSDNNVEVEVQQQILLKNLERYNAKDMTEKYVNIFSEMLKEKC